MSGARDSSSAVLLTDVCLTYSGKPNSDHDSREQFALRHVSASFAMGSMTAIVGPNGGGKSSLLKLIAQGGSTGTGRMIGAVRLHPALVQRMAWLPQDARPDTNFPVEVRDLLLSGLWVNGVGRGLGRSWFSAVSRDDARRADALLERVGLADRAHSLIGELSVGQLQRLLFARLALRDARLMLLDEPFNAVDAETSALLLDMLRTWHAEGRTLLVVTHDLDLVRAVFPETLRLNQAVLDWGTTDQVLKRSLPDETPDGSANMAETGPITQATATHPSAQPTLRAAA